MGAYIVSLPPSIQGALFSGLAYSPPW